MTKNYILIVLSILLASTANAKDYKVTSPSGKVKATVSADATGLSWEVSYSDGQILQPSHMSMLLADGTTIGGKGTRVTGIKTKKVRESWATPFYKKSSVVDCYTEMVLTLNNKASLEVRAYDGCACYRFVTSRKKSFTVTDENVEFCFAQDYKAFVPYVNDNRSGERYCYSFESYYDEQHLSEMYADSLSIIPLLVDEGNVKVALCEYGQEDYPGLFLKKGKGNTLVSEFAAVPLEGKMGGYSDINFIPTKRADYIARDVKGTRNFPWRALIIADDDRQLADNDMAQLLSPRCRLKDTSWIKPGKVAWDWWNNLQLTGVDFEAGQNTQTYKYFIDFAAANGIEYVIIDEGWSDRYSLMKMSDAMDVKAIVDYSKQKNVGIILWTTWDNVHRDMQRAFDLYSEMGVKGFKVDFFDSDDQNMMRDMYTFAEEAAKRHLILDYHGMKANGVHVAYPNVLNFEGVKGLENYRWAPMISEGNPRDDAPRYAVTIPFMRTLVGPMDYTPGAMTNATRSAYRTNSINPMSQGTRTAQLAMYTIYEAPLQMMADSPSAYLRNKECLDYIAGVPTTFDETKVLQGKVGEYIAVARRKGTTWYLGALTSWTERDITIDLSEFLSSNTTYVADVFSDGVNAHRDARDYKRVVSDVTNKEKVTLHMKPAGGVAAVFKVKTDALIAKPM